MRMTKCEVRGTKVEACPCHVRLQQTHIVFRNSNFDFAFLRTSSFELRIRHSYFDFLSVNEAQWASWQIRPQCL